jgi:hypothetical protein
MAGMSAVERLDECDSLMTLIRDTAPPAATAVSKSMRRTLQAFTNERLATGRFGQDVERAYAAARDATRARSFLTAVVISWLLQASSPCCGFRAMCAVGSPWSRKNR